MSRVRRKKMGDGNAKRYITFDPDGGAEEICVAAYDKSGNGKLSYKEAKKVTRFGSVFKNKTTITKFNEFKYFTGVTELFHNEGGWTQDWGLYGCSNLAEIEFPDSLKTVGWMSYENNPVIGDKITRVDLKNVTAVSGLPATCKEVVIRVPCTNRIGICYTNCKLNKIIISSVETFLNCTWSWNDGWINGKSYPNGYGTAHIYLTDDENTPIGEGDVPLVIPDTITTLKISAFARCTYLTNLKGTEHITGTIGSYAFAYCKGLTSVSFPLVTALGGQVFMGCTSLASYPYMNKLQTISSYAFQDCTALTEADLSACTTLGVGAFKNCTALKSVTFPTTDLTLCEGAFIKCTNLELTEIPSNITLSNGAFAYCSKVKPTTLPSTIKSIPPACFYNPKMTSISSDYVESLVGSNAYFAGEWISDAGCFAGTDFNSQLVTVNFPNCTTVGHFVFESCHYLKSVTVSPNVTSIGTSAFWRCTSLESLTEFPNLVALNANAFLECHKLPWTELADTIETIGSQAFAGCRSLTISELPSSLTTLGAKAFVQCEKITVSKIPDGITTLNAGVFTDCLSITEMDLNKVTVISGVTSFGSFSGYVSSHGLQRDLNWASYGVFEWCSGMTKVELRSVETIGSQAFKNCTALATINYDGDIETWLTVSKGSNWHLNCPATYVQCSDGKAGLDDTTDTGNTVDPDTGEAV